MEQMIMATDMSKHKAYIDEFQVKKLVDRYS